MEKSRYYSDGRGTNLQSVKRVRVVGTNGFEKIKHGPKLGDVTDFITKTLQIPTQRMKTAEMRGWAVEEDIPSTILLKRSTGSYKPSENQLRSLLRYQPEHSNNKRWLSGFGNKKKHDVRKNSLPLPEIQTTQHLENAVNRASFRQRQENRFVGSGAFHPTSSVHSMAFINPDKVRHGDGVPLEMTFTQRRSYIRGANIGLSSYPHKPAGQDLRPEGNEFEQKDIHRFVQSDFKATRTSDDSPQSSNHSINESIIEPPAELQLQPFRHKYQLQSRNPLNHVITSTQQRAQERSQIDAVRSVLDDQVQMSRNGSEEPTSNCKSREHEVHPDNSRGADAAGSSAPVHNSHVFDKGVYVRSNGEPVKLMMKTKGTVKEDDNLYQNLNGGIKIPNYALIIPGFKKEYDSSTEMQVDPSNEDGTQLEQYIQAFRSNKNYSKNLYGYRSSTVNTYVPQNAMPLPGGGVNISILMPTSYPAFVTQVTPDLNPATVDKYKKRKERKKIMKTSAREKFNAALTGKSLQIISESKFAKRPPLLYRLSSSIKPFRIVQKIAMTESGLLNGVHQGAGHVRTPELAEPNPLVVGDQDLTPNKQLTKSDMVDKTHWGSKYHPVDQDKKEDESRNVESSRGMQFTSHLSPRQFSWQNLPLESLEGNVSRNSFKSDETTDNPGVSEEANKAELLNQLNNSNIRMPWDVASYPPDFLGKDSPCRRNQVVPWGFYTIPDVKAPGGRECPRGNNFPAELQQNEPDKAQTFMDAFTTKSIVPNSYYRQQSATKSGIKKDAWDALDEVLNKNYVEKDNEPVKWQVRNMKREADYEDDNDNVGFYRLSNHRSPANMLVHVLRGRKGYGDFNFADDEVVTQRVRNFTSVQRSNITRAKTNSL